MLEKKLLELRKLMKENQLDAYLVPNSDPHNSEYVPQQWARREWISDFTGSMGFVMVTQKKAYLFADSRYFLQAEEELDFGLYELIKRAGTNEAYRELIQREFSTSSCRLGVDSKTYTIAFASALSEKLAESGHELVLMENNLVDEAAKNIKQPLSITNNPAFTWPLKNAGKSVAQKLEDVRKTISEKDCDHIVISALDEIAWMFNVRGSDIDYNPLVISYGIVSQDKAYWFVDPSKTSDTKLTERLNTQGVEIHAYGDFQHHLKSLKGKVWLDDYSASAWVRDSLDASSTTNHLELSPVSMMKACKNKVEVEGIIESHRKDAVALTKFFHWLENNWQKGVSEVDASDQLFEFRKEDDQCLGASFCSISGFASNGAIVHYRPTRPNDATIDDSSIYLLDSGGQYWGGTTDVTRCAHLGTPSTEQKKHYTLVLKGHLALGDLTFPEGVYGNQIDAFARSALWKHGLEYGHGTGHGVGCFLCVHEGPQGIAPNSKRATFHENMILSNEPGYYLDGAYGIRIENLVYVSKDPVSTDTREFFGFKNLTLFPYENKLIDWSLIDLHEKALIQKYYDQIWKDVSPRLDDERKTWLKSKLEIGS